MPPAYTDYFFYPENSAYLWSRYSGGYTTLLQEFIRIYGSDERSAWTEGALPYSSSGRQSGNRVEDINLEEEHMPIDSDRARYEIWFIPRAFACLDDYKRGFDMKNVRRTSERRFSGERYPKAFADMTKEEAQRLADDIGVDEIYLYAGDYDRFCVKKSDEAKKHQERILDDKIGIGRGIVAGSRSY